VDLLDQPVDRRLRLISASKQRDLHLGAGAGKVENLQSEASSVVLSEATGTRGDGVAGAVENERGEPAGNDGLDSQTWGDGLVLVSLTGRTRDDMLEGSVLAIADNVANIGVIDPGDNAVLVDIEALPMNCRWLAAAEAADGQIQVAPDEPPDDLLVGELMSHERDAGSGSAPPYEQVGAETRDDELRSGDIELAPSGGGDPFPFAPVELAGQIDDLVDDRADSLRPQRRLEPVWSANEQLIAMERAKPAESVADSRLAQVKVRCGRGDGSEAEQLTVDEQETSVEPPHIIDFDIRHALNSLPSIPAYA
jgi:hypothetical protein